MKETTNPKINETPYGLLRIYFRRGATTKTKGFWSKLNPQPEYAHIIKLARAHKIPIGKAKHSHMGYFGDERIYVDAGEMPNEMLPTYVELLGEKELLMSFCAAHQEVLQDKQIFFFEVLHWGLG